MQPKRSRPDTHEKVKRENSEASASVFGDAGSADSCGAGDLRSKFSSAFSRLPVDDAARSFWDVIRAAIPVRETPRRWETEVVIIRFHRTVGTRVCAGTRTRALPLCILVAREHYIMLDVRTRATSALYYLVEAICSLVRCARAISSIELMQLSVANGNARVANRVMLGRHPIVLARRGSLPASPPRECLARTSGDSAFCGVLLHLL